MTNLSEYVLNSYRVLFDRILSLQSDGWKCTCYNIASDGGREKVWMLVRYDKRILFVFNTVTGEATQYALHSRWQLV